MIVVVQSGRFTAGAPTAPGTPTIGTVTQPFGAHTYRNGKVLVGATPGSGTATSFRATSTPGSIIGDDALPPVAVAALDGGVAYTFTVHGRNAVGNSGESAASASFTPTTTPKAPTIGTATVGDTTASVAFTAPSGTPDPTGGLAITGYVVNALEVALGAVFGAQTAGASSPITVTGLTNGTAYTFTVQAVNSLGQGLQSAASNSVTPVSTLPPNAPVIGTAVKGNTQATVNFTPGTTPPAATSYTATSSPGGLTATGSAGPLVVTGLTNGVAYTFTVTATNANGTSSPSSASNSVTPAALGTNHLDANTAGLETTIGDWLANYSCTIARSTLQAHTGSASLRTDITSQTWGVINTTFPGATATVGSKTIEFWARLGSGTVAGCELVTRWRDGSGNDLQVDMLPLTGLTTSWQRASRNVVSPSGTVAVKVEIRYTGLGSGASGDFVYFDDIYVGS